MAEERSRVALRHMVLFSPRRRLPVHRNTRTFAASSVISSTYPIKRDSIRSAAEAFITLISPESYCLLIFSINAFRAFSVCNTSSFPNDFPGSGCRSVRSGGLQLDDNWSQTFGMPSSIYCTYGCNMLMLVGRKGRKYTVKCFLGDSALADVLLSQ